MAWRRFLHYWTSLWGIPITNWFPFPKQRVSNAKLWESFICFKFDQANEWTIELSVMRHAWAFIWFLRRNSSIFSINIVPHICGRWMGAKQINKKSRVDIIIRALLIFICRSRSFWNRFRFSVVWPCWAHRNRNRFVHRQNASCRATRKIGSIGIQG